MAQATAPALNTQGPMTTALFGPGGPGPAKTPAPTAPESDSAPSDSSSPPSFYSSAQDHMTNVIKNLPDNTDQMGPNPPPPPVLTPPPTPEPTNPAHAWGSTAMILAMIGSAFTRRPMIAALNAGSRVMKAYQDKDQAAADLAFNEWNAQNTNAINNYKYQLQAWSDAIKENQGDEKGLVAQLTAIESAVKGSGGILAAYDQNGVNGVLDFTRKMGQSVATMAAQSDKLMTMQLENQAWNEWQAENPKPTDPSQMPAWTNQALAARKSIFSTSAAAGDGTPLPTLPTGTPDPSPATPASPTGNVPGPTGAPIPAPADAAPPIPAPIDLNKISKEDADLYSTAYKIAHYDLAPPSTFDLSKPANLKLMQVVSAINPGYDATNYQPIVKVKEDFASGKSATAVQSFNVMVSHLKTLNTLATALNNNDVQTINRISNVFSSQFGTAAPTSFNAAKRIVTDEIVKAVTGAAGALGDREEAQSTLDAANTPAQLAGVIHTYMQLAAGQLAGYRQKYQVGTGLNDFNKFLSPDTIQTIGSVSPDSIPDTPGSAAPAAPTGGGGDGNWGIQQVQ